jgi:hypothetical protein
MKARVKATGEIVEVDFHMETKRGKMFGEVTDSRRLCKPDMTYRKFYRDEIEFLSYEDREVIDYWTRLEHQCAGMAMQGMMSNISFMKISEDAIACVERVKDITARMAIEYAYALVERLKSESS